MSKMIDDYSRYNTVKEKDDMSVNFLLLLKYENPKKKVSVANEY